MPTKQLPIDIDLFKKLFINRDDIYSVQDTKGSAYHKVSRPLDRQTIKDHLLGKQTIGLYQLKNNLVTWALVDIDVNKEVWSVPGFKIEDWSDKIEAQSLAIKKILKERGMMGYRENSGFKGEHVWVFFDEPIQAGLVKTVFDSLFQYMPLVDKHMHIEIFPKQSRASETGTGSLIKAPLGKHQRSGKFSKFIDDVTDIKFAGIEQLKKATNELDAIFQGCSALRNIRDEGVHSEHLGHEERLALAYIFGNIQNGGLEYVEKEIFSKLNDYDPEKTKHQLANIKKKGYKPVSCENLQKKGLCPGPCAAIGPNKSPIVFYYRQLGQAASEENEIKAFDTWDLLFMEGHNYYEKSQNSALPTKLSNFIIDLFEQVFVDDGETIETSFRGHITNEDGIKEIEFTSEEYTKDDKYQEKIYSVLGNSGTKIDSPRKIRFASNKYSNKNRVMIRKIFGYNDDHTKYYSPSVFVDKEGVKENEELIISLAGEQQAELLDLRKITHNDLDFLRDHITDDLLKLAGFEATHSALAHTMLPIIEPWVDPDDKSKFTFFLRGTTGTGKSFLMRAMQNFFGKFPDEVVTWGSTPYSIQHLGHYFKDALFLVDDFKLSNITNPTGVLQILQNYADTTARARLLSSGQKMAKTYVIKGTLAITGEDVIEGEASNIARMILIEYGDQGRDIVRGGKVKKYKYLYSGFTAHYIHNILNLDKEEISDRRQKYLEEFFKIIEGQPNDVRIARNFAVLMTSYYYIANFLWNKKKAKESIQRLKKFYLLHLISIMSAAKDEKSSQRFWRYLQEYLAAGKLQIAPSTNTIDLQARGAIIGFKSAGKTYIITKTSYNEVQRLLQQSKDKLSHSAIAVFRDLATDGVIKTSKTTCRTFNGNSVRVIEVEFDKPDLTDEKQ